mgnify:CR=1 FL=1
MAAIITYGVGTVSSKSSMIVELISSKAGSSIGLTGLGFIPMPTGVNATILHVPAIIAGVLEGPIAGLLVGLIFGIFSLVRATTPAIQPPAEAAP